MIRQPWIELFPLVHRSLGLLFRILLLIPALLSTGLRVQAFGQTAPETPQTVVQDGQNLPDAPSATHGAEPSARAGAGILMFSEGFGVTSQTAHPMAVDDKFKFIVEPNFGPRRLVMNSFAAGMRMANVPSQYPHEWHSGMEAYARFYGDDFARTGAQSLSRFSTSVLLHEDPRYWRSTSTSIPARLGHAIIFSFVDKTDGGHSTIALSNFTGAAAGGFIGNAYLPMGFDNLTHAGQRSTNLFGGVVMQNISTEFAPELGHLMRRIHLPHVPLPPVWWTENH